MGGIGGGEESDLTQSSQRKSAHREKRLGQAEFAEKWNPRTQAEACAKGVICVGVERRPIFGDYGQCGELQPQEEVFLPAHSKSRNREPERSEAAWMSALHGENPAPENQPVYQSIPGVHPAYGRRRRDCLRRRIPIFRQCRGEQRDGGQNRSFRAAVIALVSQ